MGLVLSVPEQTGETTVTVEAKAPQTDRWLANLPVLDTLETLERVHGAIHELNRVKLKAKARVDLLERYGEYLQRISQDLQQKLCKNSFPLPQDIQNQAEILRDTHLEMAYGYKAAIIDLTGSRRATSDTSLLVSAIYRAIRYLSETNLKSAYFYGSPPPGIWQEIHQLALYSIKSSLLDHKTIDQLNPARSLCSIAHIYKQALLMGCCDVYRHPLRVIFKTFHYLDRWASRAMLAKATEPPKMRCQFLVLTHSDQPVATGNIDPDLRIHKDPLILDTRNLVRQVHYQWLAIKNNNPPAPDGLDFEFFKEHADEFLQSIAVSWSGLPIRRFQRREMNTPCHLVAGVDAVNFFINGQKDFEYCSVDEHGLDEISTQGTYGLHKLKRNTQEFNLTRWHIVDESATGLRLQSEQDQDYKIRVGDLVAVNSKQQWMIGQVCWIRSTGHSVLSAGIKLLAPHVEPVAVKSINIQNQNAEPFRHCLLFKEGRAGKEQTTLVTPSGCFRTEQNLFLDNSKTLTMIRTQKLLLVSGNFDWFEYVELNI